VSRSRIAPHRQGFGLRWIAERLRVVERGNTAQTLVASGLMLVANLATGIMLAQGLGPSGRGETAAIMTAPTVIALFFTLGSPQGLSYFQAKDPDDGDRLLWTWVAIGSALGLLATGVGIGLIPVLFSAQSDSTIRLGQELMPVAIAIIVNQAVAGIILGDHRFLLFNLARVAVPAGLAVAYGVLLALGALTVSSAVVAFGAVHVLSAVGLVILTWMRHGTARPDIALGRTTLWYGIKGHGSFLSTIVNARLDVLIMPAFLSSTSVGLYSVATNVSWVVVALAGSLWFIVTPLATRRGEEGRQIVWSFVRFTLLGAALIAGALAVLAPFLLRTLFGASFEQATDALRILLPGSVLFAGAMVITSGLFAANRPFAASLAQAAAALVTVVGLVLFLPSGGIETAAIISTVAYAVAFAASIALYRRSPKRARGDDWPAAVDGLDAEVSAESEASVGAGNVVP
jgi:O-antigen/teichoic acid export membrane protein